MENKTLINKISLKGARVNACLTQKQVAENLDVSDITVSNWENGNSIPNIKQAYELSRLYGIPLKVLFHQYDSV